jgi:hypothetical protein
MEMSVGKAGVMTVPRQHLYSSKTTGNCGIFKIFG